MSTFSVDQHGKRGGFIMKNEPFVNWSRSIIRRMSHACVLLALAALYVGDVMAAGERFTEQGGYLTRAIHDLLVADNFCTNSKECHALIPGFVGHGDRVRITFYEIGEKNSEAFAAIIKFVIKDGIRITEGVPITIMGYRETHQQYMDSGIFAKSVKPFLILEIKQ